MPDNPQNSKKNISPDWFVQGALTRIGDTLDRLTGRRWRPSSSLATSGLIERMKMLLDRELKENESGQKFVPHNIKLKMQWDKFSTDSEENLKKLEHELLTAAVDHISDNRYYTHAPLKLEVKPDYFTEGVKLYVSYDKFDEDEREAELNVTVPAAKVADLIPEGVSAIPALGSLSHESEPGSPPAGGGVAAERSEDGVVEVATGDLILRYEINEKRSEQHFDLEQGHRLSIGRTKDNDIAIDHTSVSKHHASLLLTSEGKLVVADTGSTNGTYLNGERIAYGKAIEIFAGDKVKFGAVEVDLEFLPDEIPTDAPTQAYTAEEFHDAKKMQIVQPAVDSAAEIPSSSEHQEDSPPG